MIRFNDNKRLIKTVEHLHSFSITNISSTDCRILKPDLFNEIFFLVFNIWVFYNLRENNSIITIPIKDTHSLLLIQPRNYNTIFYSKEQNRYIENNVFSQFPQTSLTIDYCPICNGLKFNYGIFEKKLSNIDVSKAPFNTEDCLESHSNLISWLNDSVLQNPDSGCFLGGHPYLFNIPYKFVDALLGNVDIQRLFEELLIIFISSYYNLNGYSCNTDLREPFKSFELDGIAVQHTDIDNNNTYKLFVFENTNGFEFDDNLQEGSSDVTNIKYDDDRFKNKVISYQSLEDLNCSKFKYAYGSLLNFIYKTDSLSNTLKFILDHTEHFHTFSIQERFPDFPFNLKEDRIDFELNKNAFKYYITEYKKYADLTFK